MKNKKGKKLVVLGAMAALLTLIGVSGSQTYAKYVESTEVTSQQATVAKWGYVVSADAEQLFGTQHDNVVAANDKSTVNTTGTGLTVKGTSSAKLVAPGTQGFMTIDVKGLAEVDAVFKFSHESETDIHLANTYKPVKWSVSVVENEGLNSLVDEASVTLENTTLHDVLAKLDSTAFHIDAGQKVNFTITISWAWAFDQGTTDGAGNYTELASGVTDLNTNEADTMLAILANESGYNVGNEFQYDYDAVFNAFAATSSWKIDFDLTVTAEQEQQGA